MDEKKTKSQTPAQTRTRGRPKFGRVKVTISMSPEGREEAFRVALEQQLSLGQLLEKFLNMQK